MPILGICDVCKSGHKTKEAFKKCFAIQANKNKKGCKVCALKHRTAKAQNKCNAKENKRKKGSRKIKKMSDLK